MSSKKTKVLLNVVQATIVTMMSLILATTALHELSSLLDFKPAVQGNDFQISDVYNNVANSRAVQTLSDDVTIIALDGCNRNDIATVITVVDSLRPAAVGLDVLFYWEYEGDEYLIDAIKNCRNIVLPVEVNENADSLRGSYFYDRLNKAHFGAINLDSYSLSQSVRSFWPTLHTGSSTINSFSSEIVSIANPTSFNALKSRNRESETISYPSVEFPVIGYSDILDSISLYTDEINGKIVLMGDLNDGSDYHVTPVDVGTPGVKIHAYIIDTILNNKYISSTPVWLSWLIAFIVCFIFVAISFFISDVSSNLGNLVMRVLQVLCLYVFFALGCKAFINRLHYIDFAPTLLMIGLGMFAYDLWVGLIALFNLVFKKKK